MAAAQSLSRASADLIKTKALDGVILMSPRTAGVFAKLIIARNLLAAIEGLTCYCLSDAVAQRVGALKKAKILISARPDLHEMIKLINHDDNQLALK